MALVAPLGIRLSSWSHLFRKNTTDTIGSTRKPRRTPTTSATSMFLIKIPMPMPIKVQSAIEHTPRMIERQVAGWSSRNVPPLPSTKGSTPACRRRW